MLTRKQYDTIFERERHSSYPIIDAYEKMHGRAIDRTKLESMARTLACPLKVNPPNWQHGRVIYSTLRRYLEGPYDGRAIALDIGTAKGFSACVMSHAIADAGADYDIVSLDVIDPNARAIRNSVAELDGLKTIDEFVSGHINPSVMTTFHGGGSTPWLNYALRQNLRVGFAFVDGKHTHQQVYFEGMAISQLQKPGDVVVFDDCQIDPVCRAVDALPESAYHINYIDIGLRVYAVAVRQ